MSTDDLDQRVKKLVERFQKEFGGQLNFQIVPPDTEPQFERKPPRTRSTSRIASFDKTPRQIKRELDRFVIGQDAAKRALANAAFYHYRRARAALEGREGIEEYQKPNVLMVGSTGVGKTLLLKRLARIIGVPFVQGDATKFSKTGYVGKDIDSLVRQLVREAKDNVELAEVGMIFIDEIDKIGAARNMVGHDITGTGVQTELLKPMEETDVDLIASGDPVSSFLGMAAMRRGAPAAINTRHILFIVGGAFPGLDEIVQKRISRKTMGFGGTLPSMSSKSEWLRHLETEDFVEFGLLEELMGRLPVHVSLDDLSVDDLLEILEKSECSILRQHQEDLRRIGVALEFEQEALREICVRAERHGTGARGLVTEFERVLGNFKYELPDHRLKKLVIHRSIVDDPHSGLLNLLLHEPIQRFVQEFEFVTKVKLTFDQSALEFLGQRSEEGKNPIAFCWERLSGADRALRMVGRNSLVVTRQILQSPMKQILEILEAERPSVPRRRPLSDPKVPPDPEVAASTGPGPSGASPIACPAPEPPM